MLLNNDMPIFLSTYTNQVDHKSRVSIPARYRSSLRDFGEAEYVIAFPSLSLPSINCSGIGFIRNLLKKEQIKLDDDPDFCSFITSNVVELFIDVNGRVILPDAFKKHANISDKVTFIGQGNKFQIWNPSLAEKYLKSLKKTFEKKINI